ncbi:phytanoyl-CoA dioxygenase family protein [Paraburkholderia dilworthii]|uniref:phytanoyl-CoA dioxygenase family protein n=1 Tax=Paraburkholderia dilworthii TaxID=948106 RepID=UPI000418E683|nr:phytanoyl-CoA dioxygenase family protein [Paraburkholderia dilworthii]
MSGKFTNLLPGVPSVESPFFKQIFSNPSVDAETLRVATDLNRDGYAVIKFPDEDFDEIAARIKASLHDQYDWETWRTKWYDAKVGLRVLDAWQTDENVRRIATNAKVIELLSKLFGRQAWPFQTLNFPVGTQQHIHSDSIHFSSVPERFMCGVWTALEDISEDAGPLLYYPGSHKWPVYTNEHIGYCATEPVTETNKMDYETMWDALIEAHGAKPAIFTAKKGESVIWLSNLLHGGLEHKNKEKTRWSQVTHYYFEGCAYYRPFRSDPFYGSIYFSKMNDMITGDPVKQKYCGFDIPRSFIDSSFNNCSAQKAVIPPDFDPQQYLLANPDVFEAGEDPVLHYRLHGWREGRRLRPD